MPRFNLPIPLPRPAPPPPRLEVVFLGTTAASGIGRESTAAMLLRYGDQNILVDCGAKALTQLRRAGIDPESITAIVLTHWHPDHTAGLPAMLGAAAGRGRRASPLQIYAPAPPHGVTSSLAIAPRRLDVQIVNAGTGTTIDIGGGTLAAIATDHTVTSLAWSFTENGDRARRVVFSGDTRPSLAVIEAARGADLLVHEATFTGTRTTWAQRRGHSTGAQAGIVGRTAAVGTLALTHMSVRDRREDILAEAQATYPPALMPADLDAIEVHPAGRRYRLGPGRRQRPGWGRVTMRSIPPRAVNEPPDAPGELAS